MDLSDTSGVDAELCELRLRIQGVHGRLGQAELDEAVTRFQTLTKFRGTLLSMASALVASPPGPSPHAVAQQQPHQQPAPAPASAASREVGWWMYACKNTSRRPADLPQNVVLQCTVRLSHGMRLKIWHRSGKNDDRKVEVVSARCVELFCLC